MKFRVTAPNRIDLAGGTLDIHPLYVFEGEALTINLAIDIDSTVYLETRADPRIRLHSRDFGQTVEVDDLHALVLGQDLDLLARAVHFFHPPCGVNMETLNKAPRGSGLGASSALLMAMMYALAYVVRMPTVPDQIIDWGANLEAQSLGIPTGKQDYYAAVHGGLSAITFGVRGAHREAIPVKPGFLDFLELHLVVSFTGISHFSGTNNWAMMKRYIDREADTVERLREIKATAYAMREALQAGDIAEIARVLDHEWQNRKGLAEGVSTPEIEHMMASAREAGAMASKICGAGGGGCMITLVENHRKQAVEEALRGAGAQVLPARIHQKGLRVEVLDPYPAFSES